MRFHFDERKSVRLRANPKRGVGFEKAQGVHAHFRSAGGNGEGKYCPRDSFGNFMENTRRRRKPVSAEAIARVADEGKDVSRFFTNKGRMMGPIQRVNVDLALGMLEELDRAAKELNISRQAVIKTLIRQALDQQYLARQSRACAKRK
jgi:hypothetical protein